MEKIEVGTRILSAKDELLDMPATIFVVTEIDIFSDTIKLEEFLCHNKIFPAKWEKTYSHFCEMIQKGKYTILGRK